MSYLFDYYARVYDKFMKVFHLDDNRDIIKEIERCKGNIIYDIGGGTGLLADVLVKKGKEVYIIDPSVPMTCVARKRNDRIHIINEIFSDKLVMPKADIIIFKDVFHHIMNQEEILDKCFSYLNCGGYVIVQDFQPDVVITKLLFLFERCCFEKIYPIHPTQLKKQGEKIGLVSRIVLLNKKDYLYMGMKEKE